MDFSWAIAGAGNDTPGVSDEECFNYLSIRRRWTETVIFSSCFIYILLWAVKRLQPISLPSREELEKPHTAIRLMLMISMTFIFGIEIGFKFVGESMVFALNPCHVQTLLQIYLLAAKPTKVTTALFRIQMNNLNGPVLAFLFPEVEMREYTFEQATYWLEHAFLLITPIFILLSGTYTVEDISDFNWVIIGTMIMFLYHFIFLQYISMATGINMNHMLCPAVADPFKGEYYRVAAVIHQSMLCPILNKGTVFICSVFKRRTNNKDTRPVNQNNRQTMHTHHGSSISDCTLMHRRKSTS